MLESRTSCLQHLTGSLGAIGKSQADDLVVSREFDLSTTRQFIPTRSAYPLTASQMTRGPLTPPIVLYFSLGLIEVIRGSSADGAMMMVWWRDIKRNVNRSKLQLKLC